MHIVDAVERTEAVLQTARAVGAHVLLQCQRHALIHCSISITMRVYLRLTPSFNFEVLQFLIAKSLLSDHSLHLFIV